MIIVWLNRNTNTYFYKVSKGSYFNYFVGYVNQYNHEVVLIINCNTFMERKKKRISYKKMLINDTIRFLERYK